MILLIDGIYHIRPRLPERPVHRRVLVLRHAIAADVPLCDHCGRVLERGRCAECEGREDDHAT